MRLAGPNASWIRRATDATPDDYAELEDFGAASGDPAEFSASLKGGRVFMVDYRILLDLNPRAGAFPPPPAPVLDRRFERPSLELRAQDRHAWDEAHDQWVEGYWRPWRALYAGREESGYTDQRFCKTIAAPLALFVLSADGKRLEPIGIQAAPGGKGEKPRIYTPGEGWAWQQARACVEMADGNVLQAIAHLAQTHLVMEACCLATHNCMAPTHPLHHLLKPHFEGTLLINNAADRALVAPNNGVDMVMMGTIGSSVSAVKAGLRRFDFNASMLHNQLQSRGFSDEVTAELRYPYREDATPLWAAIRSWVSGYVDHYYASEDEVSKDTELQAFVKRLSETGIGGMGEPGAPGTVSTRDYLASMIAHIIFTASVQHAVVNFPQVDVMAYGPNWPLATFKLPGARDADEPSFLQTLPLLEMAHMQMALGQMLGGIHHTRLGYYPESLLAKTIFSPDDLHYFRNP